MSSRSNASVWINVATALSVWLASSIAFAITPLNLGPKPSFGLFQPRVLVDISTDDGQSFDQTNNSFLLDTAANGIVIFPPATDQLNSGGFVNEGTYNEVGLSGVSEFQVSAPYQLTYSGNDGIGQQLEDVRFMSGASPVDPTGLQGIDGILGMAGMVGRVTTLDNRTRDNAPTLSWVSRSRTACRARTRIGFRFLSRTRFSKLKSKSRAARFLLGRQLYQPSC